MYIKSLKLNDFRNYKNLNINFAKNFNIIYGNNAQGKTNIIESIFLCASGRSHRTSKDVELLRLGEQGYYVNLCLAKKNMDYTIEIRFDKDERKKININDIQIKKLGNLMGTLNAVIFSPEDLMIIKEGPSDRRRFIDIVVSQLRPSYFYNLQQYSKILSQRNVLLKDIQNKRSLIDTLDIWNKNLASIGSKIIQVRSAFIERLSNYCEINHGKLTNHTEKLVLKYRPSIRVNDFDNIKEIEKRFIETLENSLNSELTKCTTLYGPQRDDFDLLLNDMSLKLFGSQGQQRTAILSIKLSEIDIMKEETGEYPVLLLDDVMSELDNNRQEYLFSNLKDIQTFITCTDKGFFRDKVQLESIFLNVSAGKVLID